MAEYYFDKGRFVIENYLNKSPFSNFLPGIAGKKGIPLWAFYVNRGQGISGYGLQDKNNPIMEFTPANKAYESVGQIGFRSFMKVDGEYYEPFLHSNKLPHRMFIDRHSFAIQEENQALGLRLTINYFGLPNENIGALVRHVEIENISQKTIQLELLDGIAEILPAGVKNGEFKEISNLLCSWMDVDHLEDDFAFYKLRSSTGDVSEVVEISNGNYLFSLYNGELVRPITDQDLVFGMDNSKRTASFFQDHKLSELTKKTQVTANKIPCGFVPITTSINPGSKMQFDTITGYTHSKKDLSKFIDKAKDSEYLLAKQAEAKSLIDELVKDVETSTGSDIFNEYIKQNYLDNLLRGGYPYKIGNSIYHLFSRRHGDLERDYNFFSLAPEFYSQGSGNFRDVCQNRRLDSFVHPEVGSHNLKHFANLIQLDGYNPLTINGSSFSIEDEMIRRQLVFKHFNTHRDELLDFLSKRFSPGGLVNFVSNLGIEVSESEYLDDFINHSKQHFEAAFGEGYWSDHFTYILDLAESFEAIYPDKIKQVLFEENDIRTFESPVTVLKKTDKSVINGQCNIRQYGSLLHFDDEKIRKLKLNPYGTNWVKANGIDYKTNLFNKFFILVLNKHSQLDNDGFGIEMEAEKPGWNDAMNGLPGLFGSGVSETIELLRVVDYLIKHLDDEEIILPVEVFEFFESMHSASTYDQRVAARETYRDQIRFGLSGKMVIANHQDVIKYLKKLSKFINDKLQLLYQENHKIIPTYIVHEVTEYETLNEGGKAKIGNYKLPLVKPLAYQKRYLPKFLEAPARLLKLDFDKIELSEMYNSIKNSEMFDRKFKIYKTSELLEQEDYEIGRIRAFTEGWLERESDFLHMIYKYLFGLVRAGLYQEFFEELKHNLVCFMKPEIYGRNILENSSFIAPSNSPNPLIHGKGFLPRLSGSTVEVLDIWRYMMTGGTPFNYVDNQLIFKLDPIISKEFFKEDGSLSFRFMKHIEVTYINEVHKNTYDGEIYLIELVNESGKEIHNGNQVVGDLAIAIRNGLYKKINLYIK